MISSLSYYYNVASVKGEGNIMSMLSSAWFLDDQHQLVVA